MKYLEKSIRDDSDIMGLISYFYGGLEGDMTEGKAGKYVYF